MALREQDGLGYNSPIGFTSITSAEQVPVVDEQNRSTLVTVGQELNKAIFDLYKDFNAFTLLENASDEVAAQSLIRKIAGKQEAYDILAPLAELVNNALTAVDEKYKGGQ